MINQLSPEWFEARKSKITGSRIGGILGLSPFQTAAQVMRSMVREYHGAPSEFNGNVATEYGSALEPVALFEYEMQTGLSVDAAPFVLHPEYNWLGASPDGIVHPDGLIEIKCPFSLRNGGEFKSVGQLPHYHAQMQLQMACTGAEWCDFVQYSQPLGLSIVRVQRDPEWLPAVMPALLRFLEQYTTELSNPSHLEPLTMRASNDTADAAQALARYDQACADADAASKTKADALAALVQVCGSKNADISGRKLTKTTRTGSVGYAKMVKDLLPGADVEPYRGAPSEFWQVSKARG